jgi:hypothetical protein
MSLRRSIWWEKERYCMRSVGFWNMSNHSIWWWQKERHKFPFFLCIYLFYCLVLPAERCKLSEPLLHVAFLTLGISFSLPCPYVSEAFAIFSNNPRSVSLCWCHCPLQRACESRFFCCSAHKLHMWTHKQYSSGLDPHSTCLSHMHRSFPPCHKG